MNNSDYKKRILIACPISNRDWILPYYLDKLYNLNYDKKLIDIYWIINNSKDKSFEMLREYKKKYEKEYNSIKIDVINSKEKFNDERTEFIRKKYTYDFLSELRNEILKYCSKVNCDYLLSSDCDILLNTETLNNLLYYNKDIVASLIYNGYLVTNINEAYKFPNILRKISENRYEHVVNYKSKNHDKSEKDDLIECHFTGACILMSKEVCMRTQYKYHDQGEDEYWSRTAIKEGFRLWCSPYVYNSHIMSPKMLELYLNGELK